MKDVVIVTMHTVEIVVHLQYKIHVLRLLWLWMKTMCLKIAEEPQLLKIALLIMAEEGVSMMIEEAVEDMMIVVEAVEEDMTTVAVAEEEDMMTVVVVEEVDMTTVVEAVEEEDMMIAVVAVEEDTMIAAVAEEEDTMTAVEAEEVEVDTTIAVVSLVFSSPRSVLRTRTPSRFQTPLYIPTICSRCQLP
jgi:hypothetical protein